MELIVDLHLHSHYSRATSKDMNLAGIYKWGQLKGISVIGTGDITHPAWYREVSEKLEQTDTGLYQLKKTIANKIDATIPISCRNQSISFIPTVEISTIYSKLGKVRKIHQVVVLPDLLAAARMNKELAKIGNLSADGRPILSLDSKELLTIILSVSDEAMIIPAHIWTPWFGIFGSKSGFDSLMEAYEELATDITVIETGLSSDPLMNWDIPELHQRAITSNSDAHSPQKLGREATVVDCKLSYTDIIETLRTNDNRLTGTIEFYPQEGKYHFDGHRACGISFSPEITAQHQGICPVCGKPLTIGVENRIQQLSHSTTKPFQKKVEYIIPLAELIANTLQVKSVLSRRVQEQYHSVLEACGDEFSILRTVDSDVIKKKGFEQLAQAIHNMRTGKVAITPGYDGIYGTVQVFTEDSPANTEQLGLGF